MVETIDTEPKRPNTQPPMPGILLPRSPRERPDFSCSLSWLLVSNLGLFRGYGVNKPAVLVTMPAAYVTITNTLFYLLKPLSCMDYTAAKGGQHATWLQADAKIVWNIP